MEYIINELFILTDDQIVTDEIFRVTGKNIKVNEIIENISGNDTSVYYLDKNLCIRTCNEKEITMAWLDTGVKTDRNEPMMISMLKRDGYFSGYYVGTPSYLVNGMCNRKPYMQKTYRANLLKFGKKYKDSNPLVKNDYENETRASDEPMPIESFCKKDMEDISKVAEEIYGNLLFPNWKSIWGLDRYIKIVGTRINQLIQEGQTGSFVKNNTKSVIVNTGMMNLFGNDFLILYRFYEKYKTYIAECVIHSKQDYLDYGFTKEQSMKEIEPINFFKESEREFNPSIEDFDINQSCLIHIIQERKDRFPENVKAQSDSKIATQIVLALERGIRMQKRDRSYAKASYSGKSGTISWFMPLHINTELCEEPELVMAIRKTGDFYEVKTILPYDDELKDRITALSLYNKIW